MGSKINLMKLLIPILFLLGCGTISNDTVHKKVIIYDTIWKDTVVYRIKTKDTVLFIPIYIPTAVRKYINDSAKYNVHFSIDHK